MARVQRLLLIAPLAWAATAQGQSVGYNEDIKSVLDGQCQSCHASTPPALGTFAQAKAKASKILERIKLDTGNPQLMPKAAKLDAATIKLFDDWSTAGTPEKRAAAASTTTSIASTTTRPASGGGTTVPTTTVPTTTVPGGSKPGNKPGGGGTKPPGSNNGDPTPLVLDLGGHGDFRFATHPVRFDIRADGKPVDLRWPAAGTGFLALDRNGNGRIDDGAELFGDALGADGKRFADGFAALAAHDANGDGIVDRKDPAFARLVVWTDDNENGRTEPGELKPLLAYGIDALALRYEAIPGLGDDGERPKLLLGNYTAHGEIRVLADIFLESF